jgi:hypothetical protein
VPHESVLRGPARATVRLERCVQEGIHAQASVEPSRRAHVAREQRPLPALFAIDDRPSRQRRLQLHPTLLYVRSLHGEEIVGAELARRLRGMGVVAERASQRFVEREHRSTHIRAPSELGARTIEARSYACSELSFTNHLLERTDRNVRLTQIERKHERSQASIQMRPKHAGRTHKKAPTRLESLGVQRIEHGDRIDGCFHVPLSVKELTMDGQALPTQERSAGDSRIEGCVLPHSDLGTVGPLVSGWRRRCLGAVEGKRMNTTAIVLSSVASPECERAEPYSGSQPVQHSSRWLASEMCRPSTARPLPVRASKRREQMLLRLALIALQTLLFGTSIAAASSRIPITPEMFSVAAGSSGNPGLLADEQTLIGDPRAGDLSDPTSTWLSTTGAHLSVAYLDLNRMYALTEVALYDRNGSAAFRIYDDLTGELLVDDDLSSYRVWKIRTVASVTSRLRIENSNGFGRVPEIALYGSARGDSPLTEFKVTTHDASGHRNLSCDPSDCDRVVAPRDGQVVLTSGGTSPVLPGARVCIQASATPYNFRVLLEDLRGTAENPIEITNCGGQVVFSRVRGPIEAHRSVHFKVLGNGSTSAVYGIKLVSSLNDAVKIRYRSRDFEVAWVEFDDNGGTAVKAKSEERGADVVTGQPFVQTGTHLHHLRSNRTERHEAMYIGATGCQPNLAVENFPDAPLEDVLIHDNMLLDSGADALQVGCASGDVRIYSNYVRTAGYRPFASGGSQRHGIQVGPSSTGKIYQNWVEDTQSDCLHAAGGHPDGLFIYNNVLTNCPHAAYLNDRLQSSVNVVIANNTIRTTSGQAFRSSGWHRTNRAPQFNIHNNLIVGASAASAIVYDDNATPQPLTTLYGVVETAQLYFASDAQAGFGDASSSDYRLRADSPARDAGVDTGAFGVVTDLRGLTRYVPYDVGALEYAD